MLFILGDSPEANISEINVLSSFFNKILNPLDTFFLSFAFIVLAYQMIQMDRAKKNQNSSDLSSRQRSSSIYTKSLGCLLREKSHNNLFAKRMTRK